MWVGFLYTVIDSLPSASGFDNGIQKGDGTILLVVFHCKLYGQVNIINVLKEVLFIFFPLDNLGVINIPEPYFEVG